MEKELKIKVKINSKFEVESNPNLKDWNNATTESKNEYVKEQVKSYLLFQIDDIIDDLLNGAMIEY